MKKLLLLLCSLAMAAALQAQIIHVPGDYPTIQQGINAANPGDTVLVADGIYYEQINFKGKKPLMVASQFIMDGNKAHIANTVINGSQITSQDSASVVYFVSTEDTTSVLCGFTITGGKGTHSVNAYLIERDGGGIFIEGTGAKIIHNRITGNVVSDTIYPALNEVAAWGGGIGSYFGPTEHWVVIGHNTIDSNLSVSGDLESDGGGIGITYNCRLEDNLIKNNTSRVKSSGGWAATAGVCLAMDTADTFEKTAIIENNIVSGNLCTGVNTSQGGLGCQNFKALVSGNTVAGNTGICSGVQGGGGTGLVLINPKKGSIVKNNVFKENNSYPWTGGLHLESIANVPDTNTVLVENNFFLGNEARNGGGFTTLDVPVILQNNVFSGNYAQQLGGAVFVGNYSSVPVDHLAILINNTFYNNKANAGGAICSVNANLVIFNSVFWNDTSLVANEIIFYGTGGDAEISNCDITLDATHIYGPTVLGQGNIDQDPFFCFCNPDSLTLSTSSPCRDAGANQYTTGSYIYYAPLYDINGITRPQFSAIDMGAYEYLAPCVIRAPWTYQGNSVKHSLYPNPVSGSATISYELIEQASVFVTLTDQTGNTVRTLLNESQNAGKYDLIIDTRDLPAGIYYYRIQAGNRTGSGKMVVLK